MADSGVYDRWHKSRPKPDEPTCREHDQVPAAVHGTGMRWQARWRDENGKQEKKNFERKTGQGGAQSFLAGIKTDLARGTYVHPSAGKVTLRAVARDWLDAQTFEETTRETVRSRLDARILPALGDREIRTIRASVVQAWVRGMQAGGLGARTVQVTFGTLSSILSAAIDDGLIPKNPCRADSIRMPKREPKKLVPWTAERVFAVADALPAAYRAMAYVGYGTGQRQGEMLGFSPDDVDWLGRIVNVRRQIRIVDKTLVFAPPKGGHEREVPLSSETALRLSAHMQAHRPVEVTLPWKLPGGKPTTVPLFFTKGGEAIHRSWLNVVVWIPAIFEAGVVPKPKRGEARADTHEHGMHALRHAFASMLLANGVDIRALAEFLGHSDPGFTLRTYTHLIPSSVDKARLAIDVGFRAVASPVVREVAR